MTASSPRDEIAPIQTPSVRDAAELLDYAIQLGMELPMHLLETLRGAQHEGASIRSAEAAVSFDRAYAELSRIMHPVTAESLRSTDPAGPAEGVRWSRTLWGMTWLVVLLIVLGESYEFVAGAFSPIEARLTGNSVIVDAQVFEESGSGRKFLAFAIALSLPFVYGALGALAYLLRSCHKRIYLRTFDPLRRSEYLNRILLGVVSGGAIGLFGDFLIDSEVYEDYGAAFLAFLAGYSTDFLFTALERVVAAIFPRVEAQEARAEPPDQDRPNPDPRPGGAEA